MEKVLRNISYIRILITVLVIIISLDTVSGQNKKSKYQENLDIGLQYYRNSEYEKAVSVFQKLFEEKPSQYIYSYIYRCYEFTNQWEEAEKIAKQQLKRSPSYYRYLIDLGYAYSKQEETRKANKTFKKVLDNLKPNRNMISGIGNAFISRELFDKAAEVYFTGQKLMGKDGYQFHSELATLALYKGDYDGMIDMFVLILENDPSQSENIKRRLQYYISKDINDNLSNILKEKLLAASQKNIENPVFNDMLLWLSLQKKDYEFAMVQSKALDRRFNRGGEFIFNLANICVNNNQPITAKEGFEYLYKNHPKESRIWELANYGMLKVDFMLFFDNPKSEVKEAQSLSSRCQNVLLNKKINKDNYELVLSLAQLETYWLNNPDKAEEIILNASQSPNLNSKEKARLKLLLADIYLYSDYVWEAKLNYMQVEKEMKRDPIAHEAKYKNAKLSYYVGEFEWAKGILDVLKSATTKLIANDAMDLSLRIKDNLKEDSTGLSLKSFAQAELYIDQNRIDKAIYILDSLSTFTGNIQLRDDILFTKAKISVRQKDFNKADSLYQEIVDKLPDALLADDALFQRAQLQEKVFKNKELAMELYKKLIEDYSGSLFVVEAREHFRSLRGDKQK
ncbi:MAG: tetratricopeptide repeat protein [Hyphomicrobiales bacterium]